MQHEIQSSLPPPDASSSTHSDRVSQHIQAKISKAGGQISFAEYMHEALYAPGLGYYSAGSIKIGAGGDFITAPEVSQVFGNVLARQCAEVLNDIEGGQVLEFGAGTGKLAADMLQAFELIDALPSAYNILEISADLRERQESLLRSAVPHLLEKVRWLTEMPKSFVGVIIANEVLDALPVERFVKSNSRIEQVCVSCDGNGFQWTSRPATERLRAAIAEIESDLGRPLADGYTSDVSLAARGWIADIAKCLAHGVVFLFDYGISRREYYAPDRSDGWLRCHFKHHAHNDPFAYPGIQDLTAWVDFSAVAGAATANNLDILGFQNQSQFLIGGGLDSEMAGLANLPLHEQIKLSGQIKTLTLPGEMGENFKCIAFGRGDTTVPSAFEFADRTQTL